MALHGGRFELYYHRTAVTHIICSNLPDTKVRQYEKERCPTPIVRPEWVVESIRAGRLLAIEDFVLWRLKAAPGQQRLRGFAPVAAAPLPKDAIYGSRAGLVGAAIRGPSPEPSEEHGAQRQQQPQQQQQEQQQELGLPPHPPGRGGAPLCRGQQQHLHQRQQQQQEKQRQQQEQRIWHRGHQGFQHAQPPSPQHPPPAQRQQLPPSPHQGPAGLDGAPAPGGYDAAEMQQAHALAARLRSQCDVLRGPVHSYKDDPQHFLETYFKSSRLHFIGGWVGRGGCVRE